MYVSMYLSNHQFKKHRLHTVSKLKLSRQAMLFSSASSVFQASFRKAQGKVSWCSTQQAQQRDGGVLWAGPSAAVTPQRQLSPGQSLHHETSYQLSAHTQTLQLRYTATQILLCIFYLLDFHWICILLLLLLLFCLHNFPNFGLSFWWSTSWFWKRLTNVLVRMFNRKFCMLSPW